MKKSTAKSIQTLSKLAHHSELDLNAQIRAAHPLIQDLVSELCKEINRLQRHNAKQQVAHFSAQEKMKAECAEEIARDKVRVRISLPDNGRAKIS